MSDVDECFGNIIEPLSIVLKFTKVNELDQVISEPSTPTDENFYQFNEDIQPEIVQPLIDEQITRSNELNPNFHYFVLTQQQYIALMMNYVDEVKDILQLPTSIIKLLLHHFKWNKERLLEKFYEIDHEEFFREAKIINPFSQE